MIHFTQDMIIDAHKYSSDNKSALLNSTVCGCFYCLKIFKPSEIEVWIDNDKTAMCPFCNIDSVIGQHADFPINQDFLKAMHKHWF